MKRSSRQITKPPADFVKQIRLENEQLKNSLFPNLKSKNIKTIATKIPVESKLNDINEIGQLEEVGILPVQMKNYNTEELSNDLLEFKNKYNLSGQCMTDLLLILRKSFPSLPNTFDIQKVPCNNSNNFSKDQIIKLVQQVHELKAEVDRKVSFIEELVSDLNYKQNDKDEIVIDPDNKSFGTNFVYETVEEMPIVTMEDIAIPINNTHQLEQLESALNDDSVVKSQFINFLDEQNKPADAQFFVINCLKKLFSVDFLRECRWRGKVSLADRLFMKLLLRKLNINYE